MCLLRPVLEGERGALHVSAETSAERREGSTVSAETSAGRGEGRSMFAETSAERREGSTVSAETMQCWKERGEHCVC